MHQGDRPNAAMQITVLKFEKNIFHMNEYMHYNDIIKILGKNINSNIESPFDYISIAEKGLNVEVGSRFKEFFDLSQSKTADLLDVYEPTLYRWVKNKKTLSRNHAIKLLEFDIKPFYFDQRLIKYKN